MKKLLLGIGAVAAVLIAMPMFAAFEAHVVNVTAQIENALSVPTDPIEFGTVFPQEHLAQSLAIGLSNSFELEGDADDVNYIIRQKPKCGVTSNSGQTLVGPTWTGHVVPADNELGYTIDCEADRPVDLQLEDGETDGLLPSLCEYISKHPDGLDDNQATDTDGATNDGELDSFHHPFFVSGDEVIWTDVEGRLAKSEDDTTDTWTIDLAVPCFGGSCAQDWEQFVADINPEAIASEFVQPLENEHKIFGCNLWVEVTGVSRLSTGPQPIESGGEE